MDTEMAGRLTELTQQLARLEQLAREIRRELARLAEKLAGD